jgi:hypothetical protein
MYAKGGRRVVVPFHGNAALHPKIVKHDFDAIEEAFILPRRGNLLVIDTSDGDRSLTSGTGCRSDLKIRRDTAMLPSWRDRDFNGSDRPSTATAAFSEWRINRPGQP